MSLDPITLRLLTGAGQNGVVALMYHAISQDRPASRWSVSLANFRKQMTLLKDFGWTSVGANRLNGDLKNFPPKTVVLTFDDGYADNLPAAELLDQFGMTATWFVVTQDIGRVASWRDPDAVPLPLMDENQLRTLSAAGMEIGSHTLSHARLTQLPPEQIRRELQDSKADLETLLNRPVTSFAYPYGLFNPDIVHLTGETGYQVAFTTRTGFGRQDNNPLLTRRVSILAEDSLSGFARKLAFADNDVSWPKLGNYLLQRAKDRILA